MMNTGYEKPRTNIGLVVSADLKYCRSNQLQVGALGGVIMTPPRGGAPGTMEKH